MRNIIEKNEGKLTALRFIGFCLMAIGVLSLMICSFNTGATVANVIAVSFFITMLGFSLAFPSLLEGSEGLSTMRIVVFMMTNVICMLMLKIGWTSSIQSLEDIGIDQYWVGIIAFTFGAKATQSFFESRLAVPKEPGKKGMANVEYTSAEIAQLALLQNEQFLKVKFPNIFIISDAVADASKGDTHVIALYLKDNNAEGIPDKLEVKMPDGSTQLIETEIIKGSGSARIQYSQLNSEVNNDSEIEYPGSLCCGVRKTDDPNFLGIVTAAHIYTVGQFKPYFGELNAGKQNGIRLNGQHSGKWKYMALNHSQDLAVAILDPNITQDENYMKFYNKFYTISDQDVREKTQITMLSRNNKEKTGYIIDYKIGLDVDYEQSSFKKNVILISAVPNREKPQPISDDGDSGSCVYDAKSKKLIGILLGTSHNFSLVLPIEETLKSFNLTTV
jgi:hypothetical protein